MITNKKRHKAYVSPKCLLFHAEVSQVICASVTPDAANSSSPSSSWTPTGVQDYENKGSHNMGSVMFGNESTVAPAKPAFSWEDGEN